MKKKILSILLSLSMVLSFFPGMSITANAETPAPVTVKWAATQSAGEVPAYSDEVALDVTLWKTIVAGGSGKYIHIEQQSGQLLQCFNLNGAGIKGIFYHLNGNAAEFYDARRTYGQAGPDKATFLFEADCDITVDGGCFYVSNPIVIRYTGNTPPNVKFLNMSEIYLDNAISIASTSAPSTYTGNITIEAKKFYSCGSILSANAVLLKAPDGEQATIRTGSEALPEGKPDKLFQNPNVTIQNVTGTILCKTSMCANGLFFPRIINDTPVVVKCGELPDGSNATILEPTEVATPGKDFVVQVPYGNQYLSIEHPAEPETVELSALDVRVDYATTFDALRPNVLPEFITSGDSANIVAECSHVGEETPELTIEAQWQAVNESGSALVDTEDPTKAVAIKVTITGNFTKADDFRYSVAELVNVDGISIGEMVGPNGDKLSTIEDGRCVLYIGWHPDDSGNIPAPDLPDGDGDTVVLLGNDWISRSGNTVTINVPNGEKYMLGVIKHAEDEWNNAEYCEEVFDSFIGKTILTPENFEQLTGDGNECYVEFDNSGYFRELFTYADIEEILTSNGTPIVVDIAEDQSIFLFHVGSSPIFSAMGGYKVHAILGVHAEAYTYDPNAPVAPPAHEPEEKVSASAEFKFSYADTIGKIVVGEALPDLSGLTTDCVVVKDAEGNILPVSAIEFDWLCKAPDLDEGWGWPNGTVAEEGMEYGIRVVVTGDGTYTFAWDSSGVITCSDSDLAVDSAWVMGDPVAFGAIINQAPESETPSDHEHDYKYTPNNDGTHNGTCECGEDAITKEACEYENGICAKCGYAKPVEPGTYAITISVEMENESGEYVPYDGAAVTIVDSKGNETELTLVQSGTGKYSANNIVNGDYNVVVKVGEGNDQKVKTVLITVNGEDVTLTDAVMISKAKINSKVEVTIEESEDSPIAGALVGGLDNLADDIAAQEKANLPANTTVDVDIKMEIDTTVSDVVPTNEKTSIESAAQEQRRNLTFLDIEITKTITVDSVAKEPENIHDVGSLLKIVIPFDTTGKNSFAVYRYHDENNLGSVVQKLIPGTDPTEEHIEVDFDAHTITMYVRYFSTYAIGYSEGATPPTVEPEVPVIPEFPVIPANPSYMVSVAGGMDGGKIEASSKSAAQGKTVTITVTPDKGYELATLSVLDNIGREIAVTSVGNGKYAFVMPDSQVFIHATFRAVDKTCTKGTDCPIWQYTDAKATAWYHDGVHFCIENGLMNGLTTTQFAPGGTTTRAQIVTILWRREGEPYTYNSMSFADVAEGKWYTEAVRWAARNGIVDGYSATAFGPNDAITREQMAAILWRYCQYKGIDVSVGENTNILSYSDAFDIHSWAMPAMQWACGAGVIGGITDGNSMKLDPTGTATRAQVATMLQRFCVEVMNP